MDTSTNRHCSESLIASKRLWRGGLDVNTRSLSGTKAAAICGYGEWREGSRSCLSIGAPMGEPAVGRWEPYGGGLAPTGLQGGKGENPPAYRPPRPLTRPSPAILTACSK